MSVDSERTYGGLGIALLRALAEQGSPTFSVADARESGRAVGMADSYLHVLLHRLERAALVRRLKHGTYALATGLPGFPEAHPFAIGMAMVQPSAISGWTALNYHGLTDQIPRVITLTTPKRVVTPAMRGVVRAAAPSTWTAGGEIFEIVSVVPDHFFGDEEIWPGHARVRMFDRERALLDCFALPRRFGGIAEGLGIVEEHLHQLDVVRLIAHARRYRKAAVARRLGYALEHAGVAAEVVEPLMLPMEGSRLLDPTREPRGERNRRWGIIQNLAIRRRRR
jgi:predicted transcriptional regulator of viral defense system